ncbi:MAG: CPBP family intramembrane metalloprotease [Actinomycetota bacterium]|nr:CPBP family intramembrane metalloprotease [Actinomycetota bacterium]
MPGANRPGRWPRLWMASHPVTAFLILALGLTWAAQILSILILGTILPGLLAELLILLGSAVLVTAAAEGRHGVRRLFGRTIRWRVGVGWYAVVLLALPALTLLLAAATGTLRDPDGGWAPVIGIYFLQTLVLGALLGNIWEELAWAGVVQRRLMERHGLLAGSLLTAIPFALIHLPMAFGTSGFTATPADQVLLSWAVLIIFAPFFRCLVGISYLGTGGSILLVGLLHASFNSSGGMPMAGGWQQIAAVVLLLAAVAAVRKYQGIRTRRAGPQPQASGPAVR